MKAIIIIILVLVSFAAGLSTSKYLFKQADYLDEAVESEFGSVANPDNDPNITFRLLALDDDWAKLAVGQEFGGYELIVKKVGGGWQEVIRTIEILDCQVVEDLGVPQSIYYQCWNY